jgi:hypothetical protein
MAPISQFASSRNSHHRAFRIVSQFALSARLAISSQQRYAFHEPHFSNQDLERELFAGIILKPNSINKQRTCQVPSEHANAVELVALLDAQVRIVS